MQLHVIGLAQGLWFCQTFAIYLYLPLIIEHGKIYTKFQS
jgi:hypothetical protein